MDAYGFARPGLAPRTAGYRPPERRSTAVSEPDSARTVASAGNPERIRDRPERHAGDRREAPRRERRFETDPAAQAEPGREIDRLA